MAKSKNIKDIIEILNTDEESDEEFLEKYREDWSDYDMDLEKRMKYHKIDVEPSPNSVLGRRRDRRALIDIKRFKKDVCADCRDFRDVVEYRRKGSNEYVKLCLRCAKRQKDTLSYNQWYKLAKE